jgi:hypothetical protein
VKNVALVFAVYITVADAKGDKSIVEIPIPNDTALSDLPEVAQKFGEMVGTLINGEIVNVGVRLEFDISGWTLPELAETADVQERARFSFRDENGFAKSLTIPCFDETKMVAASKLVDLTDVDVDFFVDTMIQGMELDDEITWVQPCSYHGDDIVSLIAGVEAWGKARR